MLSNHEKAKKLYADCKVNPKNSFLYSIKAFDVGEDSLLMSLAIAIVINSYALEGAELMLFTKEAFKGHGINDWNDFKRAVDRLIDMGIMEKIEDNNIPYIRLTSDKFYNAEIYKVE